MKEHGGTRQGSGRKKHGERIYVSGFFLTLDKKRKLDRILRERKINKPEFFSEMIDRV
jgi:hypothetical protein